MVGIATVDVAKAAEQPVRNELHIAAGGDVLQAPRGGSLIKAALDTVRDPRPEQIFVRAGNGAVENETPFLLVRIGEAQALEWNRYQHQVTTVGEPPVRVPDGIERRIKPTVIGGRAGTDRALGPQSIPLDAERVGGESVAPAGIVEGINHDLRRIIGEDVFAARHARADFLRLVIPTHENGVQVVRSEEHTSELQSRCQLVSRPPLEKT